MAETSRPRFFYGYIIVLATFCIMVMSGGLWVIFGIFFKPMLTEFGWSRATLSGASSLWAFVMTLFGLGGGRLTDKHGPRPVVTVCGLLLGLGFFLMSRISTVWQLYLVYGVVIGIGMSGLWIPMTSTMARWFVKRRVLMTAIILSGAGLGTVIMPPLATWLIDSFEWRTSYIAVGLVALLVVTSAAQFLRRDPAQTQQLPYSAAQAEAGNPSLQTEGLSLRRTIRVREFWLLCAVFICLWFSANVMWTHIVIHAIDLGVSAITAASIPAIMGGAGIAGRLIMGGAADRVGHKPILLTGFALLSLSLLWLLMTKELWGIYLFAVIFGFSLAGLATLEAPLIAGLFGLNSLGLILGSVELVATVFAAPSPMLAGHIFDTMDSYQLAFLICAVLGIIGVLLALLLRLPSSEGGKK